MGACPGLTHGGWCWENPLPHGIELRAVWGRSSSDVWVVGARNLVMRFDGGEWTSLDLASMPGAEGRDSHLRALAAGPAGELYLGGSQPWVLRWNGTRWSSVAERSFYFVQQLAVAPDGGVWAAHGDGMGPVDDPTLVLHGQDAGHWFTGVTWTPEGECFAASRATHPDGGLAVAVLRCDGQEVFKASGREAGQMWTDGWGRPWMALQGGTGPGLVSRRDGGWKFVGAGSDQWLVSGTALPDGGSLAVGATWQHALLEHDDQLRLRVIPVPSEQRMQVSAKGVWVSPDETAFVVGGGGQVAWGPARDPDASSWRLLSRGATAQLEALAVSSDQALAGDNKGKLFRKTDAGWTTLQVPNLLELRGVHLAEGGTVFAVGAGGALHYSDSAPPEVASGADLQDVWGNSEEVLAVGARAIYSVTRGQLREVARVDAGTLVRLSGNAAGKAWAVGHSGLLLHRSGADAGWREQSISKGNLGAVCAGREGLPWAAGAAGLVLRGLADGGWGDGRLGYPFNTHFSDCAVGDDGGGSWWAKTTSSKCRGAVGRSSRGPATPASTGSGSQKAGFG